MWGLGGGFPARREGGLGQGPVGDEPNMTHTMVLHKWAGGYPGMTENGKTSRMRCINGMFMAHSDDRSGVSGGVSRHVGGSRSSSGGLASYSKCDLGHTTRMKSRNVAINERNCSQT